MTAKEYLWQIKKIQSDMDRKLKSLADMRDRQGRPQAFNYERERVQTTPKGDAVIKANINIMQTEQEIKDLQAKIAQIHDVIFKVVKNPVSYRVIVSIYEDGFNLSATADRFDMKVSRTSQLHTAGLKDIENYLKSIKQKD